MWNWLHHQVYSSHHKQEEEGEDQRSLHTSAHKKHVLNSNKSHVKNRLLYIYIYIWLTSHPNEVYVVCMTRKKKKINFHPLMFNIYIYTIEKIVKWNLIITFVTRHIHIGSLTAVTYCWSTFIPLWQIRTRVTWAHCMKAANGKCMWWFWQMNE